MSRIIDHVLNAVFIVVFIGFLVFLTGVAHTLLNEPNQSQTETEIPWHLLMD